MNLREFAQGKVVALALEYRRACRRAKNAHRSKAFMAVGVAVEEKERAAKALLDYVAGKWS